MESANYIIRQMQGSWFMKLTLAQCLGQLDLSQTRLAPKMADNEPQHHIAA